MFFKHKFLDIVFPSPAGRGSTTWQTLIPTTGRGSDFFSQKLISWVFNDQPHRECAVVGLNGSFPAAGGRDLGRGGDFH